MKIYTQKNLFFIKISKFIFLIDTNTVSPHYKLFYNYHPSTKTNFFNFFFFLKNFKNLFNFIFSSALNKKNFLIIDNSFNFLYPLYNFIYSYKNVCYYKNFFFITERYFTYRNWIYFYECFLKKFDINILILLNILKYYKYLKDIKTLKIFLISLILIENIWIEVDLFLFAKKSSYFVLKYIYTVGIFNSYFSALSFKKNNHQFFFFKKF